MTRQLKNHPHIWDNVMGYTNHNQQHHHTLLRDTTGSSVSIIDYSREEIVVSTTTTDKNYRNPANSPRPRHYPQYPPKVIFVGGKPKKDSKKVTKDGYVSDLDRECAQKPKQLAPWTFRPVPKANYDKNVASCAFNEYKSRLAEKKQRLKEQLEITVAKSQKQQKQQQQLPKKRVIIKETVAEIVKEDNVPRSKSAKKLGKKMAMSTQKNDEIRIDTYLAARETYQETVVESEEEKKPQMKQPGFYGTIEAEKCAERVAGHISAAAEHLERLKFVAEAVIPESGLHLKKLQQIGNEIKDFNSQTRARRLKAPKSPTVNQVAHFVILNSSSE